MVDPTTTSSGDAQAVTEGAKAKRAKPSSTPTMYVMTMEVLAANNTTKGMSLQAIKKQIVEKYPEAEKNFSNDRLKKAVVKGLESKEIARGRGSVDSGFRGYFRQNKAVLEQKQKEEQKALKLKAKKLAEKEKAARKSAKEKTSKSSSKARSRSKSTSRSKTTKTGTSAKARGTIKSGSLSPKSKKVTKPKKVTSPKATTPKTAGRVVAVTPKLSKSVTAGAKAKTASVKKLLKQPAAKSKSKTSKSAKKA